MLDGDQWVISGQKVWTTQAQYADYIFLLARTDPDAAKHHGISYLLVPMQQPGIEVRPITQPDGTAEFNEVFFDGARCPKDNVVGGVNNGWVVANTTLATSAACPPRPVTGGSRRSSTSWSTPPGQRGRSTDPVLRQALTAYYTKIQILRINGLRSLSAAVQGRKDPGVAALGATNKMFWSEMHRDAMEVALDIYGAEALLSTVGPESAPGPATSATVAVTRTRSARWSRRSSSPVPRRSGVARPRSSATSWVSGSSASPASPSPPPDAAPPAGEGAIHAAVIECEHP